MKKEVSRRDFLKGAAAGAAGLAAFSALPAYAVEEDGGKDMVLEEGQFAFEIPPAPVPEDEIVAEYEADVVVVGAGLGGTMATLAAAQEGASVIVLQKGGFPMSHGFGMAAFDTNLQHAEGFEFNLDDVASFLCKEAYGYADQNVIKSILEGGRDAINMAEDLLKDRGWGTFTTMTAPLTDEGASAIHIWFDSENKDMNLCAMAFVTRLCTIAEEEYGVQFLYDTPGYQLEKDESGRVVAVIGKGEDGYVRVKAAHGVVLATGDIMNNPQMVKKWAPFNVGVPCTYEPKYNTGDGHAMGLWAGALMNKGPFSQAIHFDPSPLPGGSAPLSGNPYLAINKKGFRYMNEDLAYPIVANTTVRQPDCMRYQILDSSLNEYWNQYGFGMGRGGFLGGDDPGIEAAVEQGSVVKADTIDELLDKLGFEGKNKDNAIASIERYQELVEKGVDDDFQKNPEYLVKTPVKTPPFYGIPRCPANLAMLDGFVCTPTMQLIDADREYIPGLYGCGNTVGNFFGVDYTLTVGGISIGHAIGSGFVAGKNAAKG